MMRAPDLLPGGAGAGTDPLEPEDEHALTPMQEGMLLHAEVGAAPGAYLVQYRLSLRGAVREEALRRAWERVVARHPALRSTFARGADGTPRQRVHRDAALPWEARDWRGIPAAVQEERLAALLADDLARGFDPAHGPLTRVTLVRTGEDAWRLAWTHHHLVLDGWSAPLVFGEVTACYAAERAGREPDLPARRPFRDYVAWTGARELGEAEAFWREALEGLAGPTRLAGSREAGGSGYGIVEARLPAVLTAALRSMGRAHGLTPNTLLQGAWALVLAGATGENDVVFGATVSGRPAGLEGAEEMVGLFVNTLPVRVRVLPGLPLLEWLRGIQERSAAARGHEHAPLARVQGWSGLPAGEALFDTLLAFENYPLEDVLGGEWGIDAEVEEVVSWTHFPLTVTVVPGSRLAVRVKHDRACFAAAEAERLLGRLRRLLERMAEAPGALLADLPLLDGEERRRVLEEWNDTGAEVPPACIHELFQAQARRAPAALAAAFGGERLSYAALDARAERIAAALRARGVGPEARVAVCLERSAEMLAAVLGVLKAGAAYVPLDPAYPPERTAWVLRDSGARVVLTRGPGEVPAVDGVEALRLDRVPECGASAGSGGGRARTENLAYVIYTSGSTGEPKGVLVEHRSVVNLAAALRRAVYAGRGAAEPPRVSMNGPLTFDTSVKQWVQLLAGAALFPVPAEIRADGPALAAWLAENEIDVFDCTPAQLRALLEADPPGGALPGDVLVAGEAIDPDTWRRLAGDGRRRFHNLYGPTECTVDAATCRVAGETPAIGRPVANARLYVLGAGMEPLPQGAPGELYVGGAGVARGYLGRPGLTAAAFLPDPFSPEPGARLYRTGDRARWREDGALEYLGRKDGQVKVRGFRVEPGEVEAALRTHPGVRDAVVGAREHVPGDVRLAAWVVPADGEAPAADALRRHLAGLLPAHMVPSAFTLLDALPLTRHGKVDRRALPDPGPHSRGDGGYVAPGTAEEAALAGIWAAVLGVDRVGMGDDFFALGGHSLLAMRAVARVRDALGVEVPLRALLESRTLADFAARVGRAEGAGPAGAPVRPAPRDRPLPLSFGQQRLWFLHQLDPEDTAYHMATALRLRGPLDAAALRHALAALACRHESLRTVFPAVAGVAAQVVRPPAPVPLPVVELRRLPPARREAEARRLARAAAARPFDLARGPLLRAVLLRLDAEEWGLAFTLHHVVSDGGSTGVLVREVSELYAARVEGRVPVLPDLPVQYADYAVWQRARLGPAALAAQLGYWRETLAGAPPLLELPADRPRPAIPSTRGGRRELALAPAVSRALRELARREGTTPFVVLLAGFAALLARWGGVDDVCVGTPVAGRDRTELEGVIGFFVNTVVLRTRLEDDPTAREGVRRAREAALGAFAHRDLPFEALVDELRPERTLAHTPLFQAMFSLRGADTGSVALGGGVAAEPLAPAEAAARFDLELMLRDEGDRFAGELVFRADLFEDATAGRMAEHLCNLLDAVAGSPDARLSGVELMGPAERARVLGEWSAAGVHAAAGGCVHERFAEQAARTPDAVAVACGGAALSYAELERHSGRLAGALRGAGVGPEVCVALFVERSPEMLTGVLGILRAGGAYLPLDPSYPVERIAWLLEDAAVPVLVTTRALRGRLPEHGARVVLLDSAAADAGAPPGSAPGAPSSPDHLAYVIYTSGSTGRPKGVRVPHRSLASTLAAAGGRFRLGPGDVVPSLASFAFDIWLFESLLPLLCGATVRMVPRERLLDVDALLEELAGATALHAVPALMAQVAGAVRGGRGTLPGLRLAFVGGDAVPPALLGTMREAFPAAGIHVLYGPTEAAVICASHAAAAEDGAGDRHPLGRPLGNASLYVLDGHGGAVPAGVPGELHIGGASVARDYLGRPELTAERFVPDALDAAPGARLYRTGDRVRWRADGTLEFLGRVDHQVKVRGFRIEPGEVEAALRACAGVRDAVALAREDAPGDRRLVAYVAASGDAAPCADALRDALRARLPEYMVPSAFVVLESLPLTPNGKVDRAALPAPGRPGDGAPRAAPRTPAEAALAAVWAEVLRVEGVGVHDDFFALGGDSILAIQVVARARAAGVHVTPRQLFERPTVAGLAAVAGGAAADASPADAPEEGEAPLTPAQREFFAADVPARHHWNQSILLAPRRPLDPARVERALARLVGHHGALRLRFTRGEAGWRQHCEPPGGPVPMVRIDLSALAARDLPAAVEAAAGRVQASLELARGPLLRAAWIDQGGARGARLLVVAHHLAVDGVSWRILLDDLQAAYEGRPLPPRTASFRGWAERLAAHVREGGFDAEAGEWTDPARRGIPFLPEDGPGGADAGRERAARSWSAALTAEETEALLRRVPAAYRTRTDEVLLAALASAFAAFTGEPRLLVEVEGHGREELFGGMDLSRTVGWFTASAPVLLEPRGAAGEGGPLRAVKEALRSVPLRGVGHGALRWLHPRDEVREALAAMPRPQLRFEYLGQLDGSVAEGSLFAAAPEGRGPERDPASARPFPLVVGAAVLEGRLRLTWTYDAARHRAATVERLAESHLAELRRLVAHCLSPGAGGYTPSDFPLARLSMDALDRLLGTERGIEDVYPLTPMQEGMLFHSLRAREGGAYVTQAAFELRGPLDRGAFEAAWQAVLGRHAALRTAFAWREADRPLQVVRREARMEVVHVDLAALPSGEREARFAAFLREDRARGFDPARAPLMRLALFRTGEDAHRAVWTHSHLLLDGWSLPRVFVEVVRLYGALAAGRDPALPPPPPYRGYVAWLQGRDPSRAERFWTEALRGFAAPTPLPLERPAAPVEGAYGRARLRLGADEAAALLEAARRHGLTPNTLVQGAWALLLSRYSGEDDVVFGATVSGRPAELPGVEEMVGLFINTLPLRARLAPGDEALGWLAELQREQAGARELEHTPLAQVQRWSELPAGVPLFDSILAFENYPLEDALEALEGGVRVEALETLEQTSYPLALAVSLGRRPGVLALFRADVLEGGAVERLLEQLRRVLAALAADPRRPLGAVDLLSAGEREAVLGAGRAPAEDAPARCVHELFREQAARTPHAVALRCGAEEVSFGELERRADRLARHLVPRGVGPDVRVGVFVERSPEMVVAMLGVLVAGGAFVPLDPGYPADRLAFMLADAGVRVLLAQERLAGRVPEFGGEVVILDRERAPEAGDGDAPPRVPVTPEHLFYVTYTSGSTGRPKAIEVPHRAVPGFFLGAEHVRYDAGQVLLQHSSPSWDASLMELWPALLTGGTSVLFPGRSPSPAELGEQVRRHGVTTLWLTSAYFNLVVDTAPEVLDGVSQLLVGGEALSPAHVRRALELRPGLRLVNGYGPSECTVFAACHVVPPGFDGAVVPIGRPVGDRRVRLLDACMNAVPAGVPGELCVGGPALARGYLGRPELTAEKFVPDPFPGEPGARMYRTGDRARARPDGVLEYLGRLDRQAKVRGFRIEPGEVEAALLAEPGVREAVAVVRDDPPRRLVAYVVADGAGAADPAALLERLRARLPEYMVPSAVVELDAVPLTRQGKVDRGALPAPAPAAGPREEGADGPGTPTEEVLAGIWAEVLGVERVGVEQGFFELGGDSILSFQVVARAARAGIHLTVRQLFEHPTVAALARVAGAAARSRAEQGPVAGEAPLTPIQRWFFEREIAERHHWNQAVLLRPRGALRPDALERALARLVEHHDALRLRFTERDGRWVQAFAPPGGGVPVPRHDLSGLPPDDRPAALEAVAARIHASLDLAEGPLLRAALFDLGERGERLLLAAHHLVVDGVSWRVLVEDLQAACEGRPLPPKTTSFREWAERLAEHAASPALALEAEYWTAAVPRDVPPLPVDHAGGDGRVEDARQVAVSLDAGTTRALLQDVPPVYRTQVGDVLLAALARTFARWTGESRLLVDVEGHGREDLFDDVDLSRTVGWFTTIHPVLLDAGPGGPGESLVAVKERLRSVPGRGIGFGLLLHLSPDPAARAALRALPAAGVAFNYLGQADTAASGAAALSLADEPAGPVAHPRGSRRAHLLEVNAIVRDGRLHCTWGYARNVHRRGTVERLAGDFLAELRGLVDHCLADGAGGSTPSDFALAGIDAATLAMLEADLLLQDEAGLDPAGA